jgi:hypothetical protein
MDNRGRKEGNCEVIKERGLMAYTMKSGRVDQKKGRAKLFIGNSSDLSSIKFPSNSYIEIELDQLSVQSQLLLNSCIVLGIVHKPFYIRDVRLNMLNSQSLFMKPPDMEVKCYCPCLFYSPFTKFSGKCSG